MIYLKKRRRANLTQPSLERLLKKVPSKYELVLLASKRARQIKREIDFRPEAAREYEFTKPLTMALFEIVEGKVSAEDLKYVDILEQTDEAREAMYAATEDAARKFFEEDEEVDVEVDDFDLNFEDLEEPDEYDELGDE